MRAFLTPEKEVFAIVQGKVKFALWLSPEVKDVIEEHYREDNCKSRGEFIEKAILFYEGYLHTKKAANFLPRVLSDILNSTLGSFGDRMGRLMFKQAVEENISHHLLAADSDRKPTNGFAAAAWMRSKRPTVRYPLRMT